MEMEILDLFDLFSVRELFEMTYPEDPNIGLGF